MTGTDKTDEIYDALVEFSLEMEAKINKKILENLKRDEIADEEW